MGYTSKKNGQHILSRQKKTNKKLKWSQPHEPDETFYLEFKTTENFVYQPPWYLYIHIHKKADPSSYDPIHLKSSLLKQKDYTLIAVDCMVPVILQSSERKTTETPVLFSFYVFR